MEYLEVHSNLTNGKGKATNVDKFMVMVYMSYESVALGSFL